MVEISYQYMYTGFSDNLHTVKIEYCSDEGNFTVSMWTVHRHVHVHLLAIIDGPQVKPLLLGSQDIEK